MTAVARRATRARTLATDLWADVERRIVEARAGSFPLRQYQTNLIGYVRERLKVDVITPHQEMILRGIEMSVRHNGKPPHHPRVACRSGQKTGKTKLASWIAFWFFECFDNAKVLMCAAIEAQTKNVLWDALWQTYTQAKKSGVEIDGSFASSPAGGFVSPDGLRSIKGISGREIEAVAGYSGRQLVIVDEASHLPQKKAEAFEGNSMGGEGYHFWISQPLRNEGPFYEAFHGQKDYWQTFHLNSLDIANWQAETGVRVPGLATLEKIEQNREMFGGVDSPFYILRVLGEWLRNETGKIVPMYVIREAVERWAGASEEGVLRIGYDPAGPGDQGDDHAWAVVRGSKCLQIIRRRGLSVDAAMSDTYALMRVHKRDDETPLLMIDSEGPIGSEYYGRFRADSEHRRIHDVANAFEVYGVKPSSKTVRDPTKFQRVRDELWWVLAEWLGSGGSIPNDDKLQGELHAPEWSSLPGGQLQATAKPVLRDLLNRSTDSADALAVAVRQPMRSTVDARPPEPRPTTQNVWNTSKTFNPYNWQKDFMPTGRQ